MKQIENFEQFRLAYKWTSYLDSEGNILEEPVQRLLYELTDDHIENIISYVERQSSNTIAVMEQEKAYREAKKHLELKEGDMVLYLGIEVIVYMKDKEKDYYLIAVPGEKSSFLKVHVTHIDPIKKGNEEDEKTNDDYTRVVKELSKYFQS